jgi:hypothetical protein
MRCFVRCDLIRLKQHFRTFVIGYLSDSLSRLAYFVAYIPFRAGHLLVITTLEMFRTPLIKSARLKNVIFDSLSVRYGEARQIFIFKSRCKTRMYLLFPLRCSILVLLNY